jgi:hypothetical protein
LCHKQPSDAAGELNGCLFKTGFNDGPENAGKPPDKSEPFR